MTTNKKTILFLVLIVIFSSIDTAKVKKTLHTKAKFRAQAFLQEIVQQSVSSAFCFLNSNGTVYDLNPLHNSTNDYQISGNNYMIDFNVCKNAIGKCGNSTGLVRYTSNAAQPNECLFIAGDDLVVSKWALLTDTVTNKSSLQLDLPQGDICKTDKTKNYTTTMVIECNPNAEVPELLTKSLDINSCQNTILISSKSACAKFNVYALWNSILANKWIFGSLVIMGGIFFCFFGIKFIQVTEILTGVAATAFVLIYLLFSFLQIEYSTMEFWLIIAGAVLAGIIVGFLISYYKKIPVVIIGAFLGYIASMFLFQLFLKYITYNPTVVYWVTMASCILVLGILAWFFYDHILILGTSFIGAYGIVRGISFMAGHFPDEKQIIDLIERGEWEQVNLMLNGTVYAYLISLVILGIVGAYIQYKYFYESEEDQKKKQEMKTEDDLGAAKKLLPDN